MKTVDIPGGQAVLRERGEIRGRDRKLIQAAAMVAASAIAKLPDGVVQLPDEADDVYAERARSALRELDLTRQEAINLIEFREASAVALLHSWTLEMPLPTMDTIGDFPDEIYGAITSLVVGAALGSVGVDFEVPETGPKGPDFESSPTSPSSNSEARLEGERLELTSTPANGTEASVIAGSFQD